MKDSVEITTLRTLVDLGLYSYVPNEERVLRYIGWLHECQTLKQVLNQVMFYMLLHEELVSYETALKKNFYNAILPFIKHICISIPITTWRDGILRQWKRIKNSSECNNIYRSKGKPTIGIPNILPKAKGLVGLSVSSRSSEIVDVIRYDAKMNGVKCEISQPKTLAGIRMNRMRGRMIHLSGNTEVVATVLAPLAKTVKIQNRFWNPAAFAFATAKSPVMHSCEKPRVRLLRSSMLKNGFFR